MNLKAVEDQFLRELQEVKSPQDLLNVKARFLGKRGHLSTVLHELATLPADQRPVVGQEANQLKGRIEQECRSLLSRLTLASQREKEESQVVDVTLPGRTITTGRLHPITQTLQEVSAIFAKMGFSVFEGPEIENDYYNFEALNIPANHPARDMQDTFYLGAAARTSPPLLLRTHTSPVQIHVMEKNRPPIRMIAPGTVYRRDSDLSHSPMFHQVEGLVVGEGVRFSDLKGVVARFLESFLKCRFRFRPSYFPFTEPSAEVDIEWESGWLEVMGCGMVHPNVFRKVGYDPKRFTGFAFGMGIERLAMLKFEIPDIRTFYENDLRFLEQF